MHAIAVSEFGGPEVLELRDVPIPEPGPGQLRVRVRASTVAKIDISTQGALAPAPRGTPYEQAATIPLAGLTADRALALELSALAEARRLTLRVAQTIPLAEAAKAQHR
jgi:NADPH:quinone reductase-like Zn-dependent oxidoreductase